MLVITISLILFHILSYLRFFVSETVVEPLHEKNKQYYFHRKFRRVPTIDECEIDDELCIFESNEQFKRDKFVLI